MPNAKTQARHDRLRSTNRAIGRLLVACTREHDWSVPVPRLAEMAADLPPDRVLRAAEYHRVVGCLHASLAADAEIPASLRDGLATAYRRSSGRALLSVASLRAVREALGDEVPWMSIKGPVLDFTAYSRPRLRTYRDLDVLVAPAHLERAVERLEGAGYQVMDRNWQLIVATMASQLHLEREGSAPIDLHWTLVFGDDLREVFRFPVAEMVARARTVEVAGGPVDTLDPADTLLHLAVHAGLEGADRLVWLKDVDMVARGEMAWSDVIERSKRFEVRLLVGLVLARCAQLLGTPVPHDVLVELAPRWWRASTDVLDAVFPASASTGLGTPATLLARSTRGDVGQTVRQAGSGLVSRVRSMAGGHVGRVDVRFDPENAGSLLHPLGGDQDRATYFERLAAM